MSEYISILSTSKPDKCEDCFLYTEYFTKSNDKMNSFELDVGCLLKTDLSDCPIKKCSREKMEEIESELE
jgi:hypothetical protein